MRVKGGPKSRRRHKRVLKQAKGYYGQHHKAIRSATATVDRALEFAYVGRKLKKRNYRSLWITRINAAVRPFDLSYSRFMSGLTKAGVDLDRRALADLAWHDPSGFEKVVGLAKQALG